MSLDLKLTRPNSIRLILDSDARIEYPAASRVMPRDSRSRLSCEPSSMRRTTDPPGSTAVTSPTLPIRSISHYFALDALRVPPNPEKPDCAIKRISPYSFDYRNGKPLGRAGKWLAEETIAERPILGQFGRVHVHLPLHLLCALGTMVLAAPACSFVFDVL